MLKHNATPRETQEAVDDLLYRVDVTIRYHRRRRAFFDNVASVIQVTTLLGASAAVAALLASTEGTTWKLVVAMVIAIAQAANLTVRPDHKAREHHRLAGAFMDIERSWALSEGASPMEVRALQARILEIERDEPPHKRLVYYLAHNDYARSINSSDKVSLTWWQRAFANWADVGVSRIDSERAA